MSSSVSSIIHDISQLLPDFDKHEPQLTKLIQTMIDHKPLIQQDPHFKEQLANRLSRHIAWKQEGMPSSLPTSGQRWTRLVTFGIPGIALGLAALYLLPRSPRYQLSHEMSSTDHPVGNINSRQTPTQTTQDNIDNSIKETTTQTPTITKNDGPSQIDNTIQHTQQTRTTISPNNTTTVDTKNETSGTPDTIAFKTSATLADQNIDDMTTFATATVSDQEAGSSIIYSSTYHAWDSLIQQASQILSLSLKSKEGNLVDCVRQTDSNSTCTILKDWPTNTANKLLLLNELRRSSPDSITTGERLQVQQSRGL